jgi:hypothetical protein
MAIDYEIAGPWALHVRALAMGESAEIATLFGDGGCAFGVLQQHPSFFSEWYGVGAFPASASDSWVTAQIKAASAFLDRYVPTRGLDLTIQAYQAGATAVFIDGKRNQEYLDRWTENFNKLKGQQGE